MINYKLQSVKGKDLEPGDLIFLGEDRLFAYLVIEYEFDVNDFKQELVSVPGYVKVGHNIQCRKIYKRIPKKARSEWHEYIQSPAYLGEAKAAGLSDD